MLRSIFYTAIFICMLHLKASSEDTDNSYVLNKGLHLNTNDNGELMLSDKDFDLDSILSIKRERLIKSDNNKDSLKYLIDIGYIYLNKRNYSNAILSFSQSYDLVNNSNTKKEKIYSLYGLGLAHYKTYHFDMSYEYFNEAYSLALEAKHDEFLPPLLMMLGKIKKETAFPDMGVKYFKQCYDEANKQKMHTLSGMALNNTGECFQDMHDQNSAKLYYEKSYEYNKEYQNYSILSLSAANLGKMIIVNRENIKEDPSKGIDLLKEAISYARKALDTNRLAYSHLRLSEVLSELNFLPINIFYNKALENAHKAVFFAKQIGALEYVKDAYYVLGNTHYNMASHDSAAFYMREYARLSDSYLSTINKKFYSGNLDLSLNNDDKNKSNYEKLNELNKLKIKEQENQLFMAKQQNQLKMLRLKEYENRLKIADQLKEIDKLRIQQQQNEIESKARENESIMHQAELKELNLKNKNAEIKIRNIILINLIIFIIAGIIFIVYLYKRYEKNKDISRKLKESKKIIEKQNNELYDIIDKLYRGITSKDTLIYVLTHDLRAPAQALSLLSKTTTENLEKLKLDEIQDNLSLMREASIQLDELLNITADWLYNQKEKMDFNPIKFELSKFIKHMTTITQFSAINFELDIPQDREILVFADKNMLHTALRNLIYMVGIRTHPNNNIKLKLAENGEKVNIVITAGDWNLSKDQIEKYFRLDLSLTNLNQRINNELSFKLHLIRSFIEQNSGKFWIDSNGQNIANFYISLFKIYD